MKIEDLDKVLSSNKNIENVQVVKLDHETIFERVRLFTIRGQNYKIEWWTNGCYLWCGELSVYFSEVEISGTWPNRFKNNLQFYYDGETVAVIPIEEYEN